VLQKHIGESEHSFDQKPVGLGGNLKMLRQFLTPVAFPAELRVPAIVQKKLITEVAELRALVQLIQSAELVENGIEPIQ
jgi:hypothetical protein